MIYIVSGFVLILIAVLLELYFTRRRFAEISDQLTDLQMDTQKRAAAASKAAGTAAFVYEQRRALHRFLAAPRAEGGEQLVLQAGRELLGLDAAAERDRLLELIDVVAAGVALGQVRLEADPVVVRQGVLEVVGDDLDELAAGHLG